MAIKSKSGRFSLLMLISAALLAGFFLWGLANQSFSGYSILSGKGTLAQLPEAINFTTIMLSAIAGALIISVITMSNRVLVQKRRLAGQLDEVIRKTNASLIIGDKAGGVRNYNLLRRYLAEYQNKIGKKDFKRLHSEGIRLYDHLAR